LAPRSGDSCGDCPKLAACVDGTVLGLNTEQRDAGLLRAVGPWTLAASTICNVVGAGIFAVPGALAASVGPYAPLALLVCALAVAAVAICFAEGGSRVASSGGCYA
jgi:basic amino acid/polyamine antiporter, APA family